MDSEKLCVCITYKILGGCKLCNPTLKYFELMDACAFARKYVSLPTAHFSEQCTKWSAHQPSG